MGLTYAEIEIANAGEIYLAQKGYILPENVKKITVKALVDSGAYSNPKSVVIFPSISTHPNPPLTKGRARVGFYILIANHLRLLYMLAINESIKRPLDLPKLEEQIAELADGSKLKLEIVGPVEVRFENRSTTCRAMVLSGDTEVLLGAIPVEDMDVLIDPRQQRLIVNPASPYLAKIISN